MMAVVFVCVVETGMPVNVAKPMQKHEERHAAKPCQLSMFIRLGAAPAIVQEAIDRYLDETAAREDRTRAALRVLGTFDDESAEALTSEMQRNRESWR